MFYFKTKDKISVVLANGSICEWSSSNSQFSKINKMVEAEDWIEIENFIQADKNIIGSEKLVLNDKGNLEVTTKKKKIEVDKDNRFTKLCSLIKENGTTDADLKPVIPFLKKVAENTFIDATKEIYDYCKNMDFEITKDGNILAFKVVNSSMKAKYDNETEYKLGKYTEVENFDTDRNTHCSRGLHFCARGYLNSYAEPNDVVLILEIDPRDIVSIPTDCDFKKGRCRKCKVVRIIGNYSEFVKDNKSLKDYISEIPTVQETIKLISDNVNNLVNTVDENKEAKPISRLEETYNLYEKYTKQGMDKKKAFEKISKDMNISISTVGRNLRKYKNK